MTTATTQTLTQTGAFDALVELGVSRARALNALNEAQYGDDIITCRHAGARPVELYGVVLTWDRATDRFTITPADEEE